MELTASQVIALRALMREAGEVNARLNRDRRAILAEVERAHGLPAGAIGRTHDLDLEAGTVVERPPQPPRVPSWQETYGGAPPEPGAAPADAPEPAAPAG